MNLKIEIGTKFWMYIKIDTKILINIRLLYLIYVKFIQYYHIHQIYRRG